MFLNYTGEKYVTGFTEGNRWSGSCPIQHSYFCAQNAALIISNHGKNIGKLIKSLFKKIFIQTEKIRFLIIFIFMGIR